MCWGLLFCSWRVAGCGERWGMLLLWTGQVLVMSQHLDFLGISGSQAATAEKAIVCQGQNCPGRSTWSYNQHHCWERLPL